jgi:hypothetical protein
VRIGDFIGIFIGVAGSKNEPKPLIPARDPADSSGGRRRGPGRPFADEFDRYVMLYVVGGGGFALGLQGAELGHILFHRAADAIFVVVRRLR